jgi:CHAT domain-containing protein
VHFYSLGVFSAYKLGDYNLMLSRMELTKARASLRQMIRQATETDPGTLETEIRKVSAELDSADDETAQVLRERRRTLWDLLAIRRAETHRQKPPPEFSLSAVQEALEPDEAVVYYYWLQPGVLLIIALSGQEIVVTRQLLDDEYTGIVKLIDYLGKLMSPMPKEVQKMLDKYGKLLLPDPVQKVLTGSRRVIFSPHRVLHLFPFHALRWKGDYLITRLAVSYAPNLSSLLVGNPPVDTSSVLAVALGHFTLPDAVKEVDDISAIYTESGVRVEVLQGDEASLSRLRGWANEGQLSSFRVIHLATHGQDILGDTPLETFLYLHDGLLDGLEVSGWRLNAELVVLSACHSGKRAFKGRGMKELPGDEMFGLQAGFFSAGARRIIGALWLADDKAAYTVMTEFHRRFSAGLQPEFALQSAVCAYLQSARIDLLKNPFFWAPFFISVVGRPELVKDAREH